MLTALENPQALCRMQPTQPAVSLNFFPLAKVLEVLNPEQLGFYPQAVRDLNR